MSSAKVIAMVLVFGGLLAACGPVPTSVPGATPVPNVDATVKAAVASTLAARSPTVTGNAESLDAWGNAVNQLLQAQNYTDAEKLSLAFLEKNPNSLPVLRTLARNIYYPQNRLDEAITTMQRVLTLGSSDSNHWDDLRVLAILLTQAGRVQEALPLAQQSLKAAPQEQRANIQALVDQLQTLSGISLQPTATATKPIASPTPISTPKATGKIVFDSPVAGKWQVFIINPDGSGLKQLTNIPGGIGDPAISPDGRSIVTNDGVKKIYVMKADGTDVRTIYEGATEAGWPAWSPDSKKIVFASRAGGYKQLFEMNADGTGLTRLTNSQAEDLAPAYSPDGTKVVFSSNRSGTWEIYALTLANGQIDQLTNLGDVAGQGWPSWSPDGRSIAFESRGKDNGRDIFTMNPDGTGVENLTNSSAYDGAPVWSPDGQYIAFASNQAGTLDIFIMRNDGSQVRRLTNIWAWGPSWSSQSEEGVLHKVDARPIDTSQPPTPPTGLSVENFERYNTDSLNSTYQVNDISGGNPSRLHLVGSPHVGEGAKALAFEFKINHPAPDDYAGFERYLSTPQNWSGNTHLCLRIDNQSSAAEIVFQFRERGDEEWKHKSSLASIGTGDYCIPLSKPTFTLAESSTRRNGKIDLGAIVYYGIYISGPEKARGTIYFDNIRVINQ